MITDTLPSPAIRPLPARGRPGLDAVAPEVVAAGGVALAIETDAADAAQVRAAAARVEAELGPIARVVDALRRRRCCAGGRRVRRRRDAPSVATANFAVKFFAAER